MVLSHEPFLLVCTYHLARAGFNKVNGLANQSRRAREPLLARCGNAGVTGTVGAIANAVWHATGVRVRCYPIRFEDGAMVV